MQLNPKKVAGLKPQATRYEVRDDGYPLYVVVQPSGIKSFVYRGKHGGRFIRKTVGQFPSMSLKKARDEASAIRVAAKKGDLPKRRGVKDEPLTSNGSSLSVREAWALYMADEGDRKATADIKWARFNEDIAPIIGDQKLTDLTHEDVDAVIQRKYDALIESGGKGVGANRLHNHLSRFFRWCRTKGRAKTGLRANPMEDIVKRADEVSRRRVLSKRELVWLFQALPEAGEFAKPFEMILRTLARRGEILNADRTMLRTDERHGLHLDLPKTKNGDPHLIPLTSTAAALIDGTGEDQQASGPLYGVSAESCSNPVERVRAKMAELALEQGETVERWTLHDLRRTGASTLPALGVPSTVVARLLNHKERSVTGIYNRYDYYDEKRRAVELWNEHLDAVKAEAAKRSAAQPA